VHVPRICGSIANDNLQTILNSERFVDYFELRLDLIGHGWEKVAGYLNKPWVACNRSQIEGARVI